MSLTAVRSVDRYPNYVRRWRVARRAVQIYLASGRNPLDDDDRATVAEYADGLAVPTSDSEYLYRLIDLRDYAIDQVNDGTYDRDDVTELLEAFGFDGVPNDDDDEDEDATTRKLVMVNVTLSFSITNDASEDATRNDIDRYLEVYTRGNVDDLNHGSVDVSVDDVSIETDYDY